MKPPLFTLVRPDTEDGVLAALAEHGAEATLLAGGQSLVPMLNFRIVAPSVLIDLNRVAELGFIREYGDGLEIGAMTRHGAVEDSALVAARCPLLKQAVGFVAHRAIRNRGTIGGSLALAYPGAEMPLALVALGAEVELRSARGSRLLPVADFVLGALDTALDEDEYIRSFRVSRSPPQAARASSKSRVVTATTLSRPRPPLWTGRPKGSSCPYGRRYLAERERRNWLRGSKPLSRAAGVASP